MDGKPIALGPVSSGNNDKMIDEKEGKFPYFPTQMLSFTSPKKKINRMQKGPNRALLMKSKSVVILF